ncbi:50S ribosomal protein L11 methyltransferase [Novosphingobium sp.]|uniref:50S ribosomal protein L11 methyltransferase n=1 Tax=Novosphingobium sp. TaxID=1874826 RepID=UPI0025D7BC8D|nr:50S ribosomal protein L11 methyltransferase [Novosphingobium sp.]MCC6926939.1 50S ribosomal protein L11 methyltransferase [Novosphingobium sp.]
MSEAWKLIAYAPRTVIEGALLAHEDVIDWDPEIVISGSEVAEDRPDEWQLEAWLSRKPNRADKAALLGLFADCTPMLTEMKLPEVDWLTQSQQDLKPIVAGRFRVHTPDHQPLRRPGLRNFVIPASQAFGTGQHATTAGCLTMLSEMKRRGLVVRNCADIGTGTGLLAFAALHLWPGANATASDIDTVCIDVVDHNAGANGIQLGAKPGELTMLVADGMDHPLLKARGPYDLILANILAGPLIDLAPHFSRSLLPGGSLLLAGLLETQEAQVRRACRRAGLRIAERIVNGDWSILWLRKRNWAGVRPTRISQLAEWSRKW